ncbi:copper amine oxidase N-terminal domain-containing protein [Paenibacillus endoradicis]|uniref:copper amine oxidase N-terminal domain-containing protein n=1 Tax=Paenibacillus endoradicis TaxID=2972487 RepID=UPI002159234D|nr:copper amine oxidase N-terminal domain-containing protein [Paenibacillus endoradicis]MCR8656620.1 copper amine oxidase N-terminal domain-containing protein [Paenibacillus endoradicis]
MLKSRYTYSLLILLLLASYSTPYYAASASPNPSDSSQRSVSQPSVTINGQLITLQGPLPTLVKGKTYVPAQLFEHPDIQAEINEFLFEDDSSVSILYFNGNLSITPDSSEYWVQDYNDADDGSYTKIEWKSRPPFLLENDLMVPMREVAERIGISVDWDVTTRTAMLTTDADFRAELESPDDWAEWLGRKPLEIDDPSGKSITEEDLSDYIILNDLTVLDKLILHKYTAVLLIIEEEDDKKFLSRSYVDRLRNGKLDSSMAMITDEYDGPDVVVHRFGHHVSVGMFEQGLATEYTHFEVNYFVDGERVEVTYDIAGKQGMFFDIPEEVTFGNITFYGKNGYTFETYFW